MIYQCDLGQGRVLYLENLGDRTQVTIASQQSGQQQQSSNTVAIGIWTTPPQVFATPQGFVLYLRGTQGAMQLLIQGTTLQVQTVQAQTVQPQEGAGNSLPLQPISAIPTADIPGATSHPPMPPMQPMQPMPSMQPIQPMQPMPPMQMGTLQMGDMQMNLNPMEMRMGNMHLSMNAPVSRPGTGTADTTPKSEKNAGENATPRRFCPQCGHGVQPDDRFCSSCGQALR